jgi:hypothetical protein
MDAHALPPLPLNPEHPMPPSTEVRLDGDTIDLLRDEMRLAAREAAKEVLMDAMTEENARKFFKVGTAVVREEFKLRAGGWLLEGIGTFFSKGFWFLLFAGAVLYYAGPKVLGIIIGAVLSPRT